MQHAGPDGAVEERNSTYRAQAMTTSRTNTTMNAATANRTEVADWARLRVVAAGSSTSTRRIRTAKLA